MGRHELPDNTVDQPTTPNSAEVTQNGVSVMSAAFWVGVLDRALKSFAQALLLLWGADQGLNILDVDWKTALGLAGGAALLSFLTSLLSAPLGDKGSSSFLPGGA